MSYESYGPLHMSFTYEPYIWVLHMLLTYGSYMRHTDRQYTNMMKFCIQSIIRLKSRKWNQNCWLSSRALVVLFAKVFTLIPNTRRSPSNFKVHRPVQCPHSMGIIKWILCADYVHLIVWQKRESLIMLSITGSLTRILVQNVKPLNDSIQIIENLGKQSSLKISY